MIKDFLLIGILLIVIVRCILLHKEIKTQREYFIDTLSHNIRVSVIAQIRGLDLLQKELANTEAGILVDEINKGCKYTFDMITMILNAYRYQNGEQILNYESINLEEVVALSCNQLAFLADEKNINFNCQLEKNSIIVADKYGISKAIYTLVSTAIYNSNKNKPIYITTETKKQSFEISVMYHGKSLTEEECKRIYSDNSKFSTVGHGIKMHLCKKIIDYHHGKLRIKNCGENRNSFTIQLPLDKCEDCFKSLEIVENSSPRQNSNIIFT